MEVEVELDIPPQPISDETLLKCHVADLGVIRSEGEGGARLRDYASHQTVVKISTGVVINRAATCRLAENSYTSRIAAEMVNIVVNPLNGEMLVEEAWVW